MDQPKLTRLLRVMMMLTSNSTKSIDEMSHQLNMSPRTVYRYIDTFRDAGFVVKKKGSSYHLDKASPYFREISELIHFTDEEAYLLKAAIESIDQNNLIKQNLKKKLYTVYDYKILADTIVNSQNSLNVKHLVEAIESKRKVILHNYSSANSSEIRNRKVEAFAFTTNYVQVWCFESEHNDHKLFSVARIGSVDITNEPWENESKHERGWIDAFRMHADCRLPIKLKLSLRAASLLTEEFPLANAGLQKLQDNEWIYEAHVCSYDGVGRFVMGLLDREVEILATDEFKAHIRKIVKNISKKMN